MVRDKPLQLLHERGMTTNSQVSLDPLLQQEDSLLIETGKLTLDAIGICVSRSRPPPERERVPQLRRRGGPTARAIGGALKLVEVDSPGSTTSSYPP